MTIHVNIGEAKTRLSELVAAAKRGEEVIINRSGLPEVRLVAVEAQPSAAEIAQMRRNAFGSWQGKLPEGLSWKESLSDEELALWYGPSPLPGVRDESSR